MAQGGPRRGRGVRGGRFRRQRQPHQLPRDAAPPAVQDADDDLLPHVATLVEADRAVLDAGLERDRVGVEVRPEARAPRLDAHRLQGLRTHRDRPGGGDRGAHGRGARAFGEQVDTGNPQGVGPRDARGNAGDGDAAAPVRRQRAERDGRAGGRRAAGLRGGDGLQQAQGVRSVQTVTGPGPAQVLEADVLGEHERVEALDQARARPPVDVQEQRVAGVQHVEVEDHPALRREPRRVAALALGQGLDVVRQEPLQEAGPVGSPHGDEAAVRAVGQSGAGPEGEVVAGIHMFVTRRPGPPSRRPPAGTRSRPGREDSREARLPRVWRPGPQTVSCGSDSRPAAPARSRQRSTAQTPGPPIVACGSDSRPAAPAGSRHRSAARTPGPPRVRSTGPRRRSRARCTAAPRRQGRGRPCR